MSILDNMKKDDTRPRKGGWCSGEYLCTCRKCGCKYQGDKRSWNCADCAYEPVGEWHVWEVENYFYAANKVSGAIECHCNDYGCDPDDVCFDTEHSDSGDFYDAPVDEIDMDSNRDRSLREQAEIKMKEGESLPFMVAVSYE